MTPKLVRSELAPKQGGPLSPYANGIAQFALAAISALAIGLTVTTSDSAGAIWWILVLGVGAALVLWLATSLPMRYRVTSAAAYSAHFLLHTHPVCSRRRR